jgi:hypothetical protein
MRKIAVYLMLTLLVASSLPLNASADETQDIPQMQPLPAFTTRSWRPLLMQTLSPPSKAQAPSLSSLQPTKPLLMLALILRTFDTPEENDTLSDILLHHVVAGEVPASAVT